MLKSKSFLCIDFGAMTVKAAEFEPNETGSLRLKNYVLKGMEQAGFSETDRETVVLETLKQMLAEGVRGEFEADRINVCAPGFQVFSKFVKLPATDPGKVGQIIQYEAQQNVPFPLEEVVWDYQILGTQGIFWDVTARVRGEEKLKKAHADLARSREDLLRTLADLQRSHNQLKEAQLQIIEMEKMQSIGQMAAGIAHEVKNPLAVIRMGLDFLGQTGQSAEEPGATVLKDMNDALHRADSIIMGLLDFSTPGKVELKPADLNTLVRSALNLVKHELKPGHIRTVTELMDNLPPVLADANKLKQVFVNALTNAAHAMSDGGTLTVRTYLKKLTPAEAKPSPGARQTREFRAGERVLVTEIDDTGTGIPENKLARVFEPFFTTKPAGKGTGLGLTVTRKIVELHEGGIQLQNLAPTGARATITLRTERS